MEHLDILDRQPAPFPIAQLIVASLIDVAAKRTAPEGAREIIINNGFRMCNFPLLVSTVRY